MIGFYEDQCQKNSLKFVLSIMAISDGSTIACGQDDNMRETECHISGGKLSCGEGERMLCISKEWQPKSQHIKK